MQFIKKIIKKIFVDTIGYEFFEKKIFLEGSKFAFLQSKKIQKVKNLSELEFSVFSQWGDDGIINWLTDKIPIKNRIFVEIGTEDYKESNTRFLLKYKNWKGYLIESNDLQVKNINKQSIVWKHDLEVLNIKVQKKNINKIFKNLSLPKKIGLLSLDIDSNDYWIWSEIDSIKPTIFVCEFNSTFGDKKAISVPYDEDFERKKLHYSNLAFGASLEAFKFMCKKKNYTFIGTNSSGVNAYFVDNDYIKFIKKKIKKFESFPSKIRESRDKNFKKSFVGGNNRFNKIKGIKVVDIKSGNLIKLDSINKFYSNKWKL